MEGKDGEEGGGSEVGGRMGRKVDGGWEVGGGGGGGGGRMVVMSIVTIPRQSRDRR